MHLGFDAASAVVAAPSSPERTTEVFRCPQCFIARDRACRDRLPWLGVLAGRYDRIGPTFGNGVMALSGVVGAVGCHTGDLLIGWDLGQEFGQHGRVADIAAGDLDRPNLQCFFIDPDVDLAPDAALRTAMLAGVPLSFSLDLDPRAVDQEVQRTLRPPMRDVHSKGLLATAQGAEVGHIPVQANEPQQALNEPCRLPQRHAEKHLHRQAGLDGSVAVDRLSPTLAGGFRRPNHVRIKPDCQRPAALERPIIRGPVQRLVGRCVRSAHDLQLSRWIHNMNP